MIIPHYLAVEDVEFNIIPHDATFAASHLAEELHIPGQLIAKTVLLKSNHGAYCVAVLPATRQIDLVAAAEVLGATELRLAFEEEVADLFRDCEPGAVPPFGSHYFMETLIDSSLLEQELLTFESNKHDEAVQMKVSDYLRLESHIVGKFAV